MNDMIRTINGRYWHNDDEISEDEYLSLFEIITAKNKWVNDVFSGSASIENCPKEWKDEVAKRVKERQDAIDPDPDIDEAEVYDILFGGGLE